MRRAIFLLCSLPAIVIADESSIQPALDAAQRRQERLKSVSIRWKVTTFVPKGGRMDRDPVGLPLPRADQTIESIHSLVLDGDRFRSEHYDPGFRMNIPNSGDGVRTFDGERNFHRFYPGGRDKPADLVIERPTRRPDFGSADLWPHLLWCRGGEREPYDQFDPRSHTVSRTKVDGSPVIQIRSIDPKARRSHTYNLDPQRDYIVRRIRRDYQSSVEVTDIEYRERPGAGWVPCGWTIVKTRAADKLVHRIRAVVNEIRIGEQAPAEVFRLEPALGETIINDEVKKTYNVRADGSLEEFDPNAAMVAAPEPPPRPAPNWPGRSLIQFVLLPGLGVAIIGGLILRRRRSPPNTPSP
jgi:hypothetical protein